MIYLICILAGLVFGVLLGWAVTRLKMAQQREAENEGFRKEISELSLIRKELETRMEEERKTNAEKLALLEDAQQKLTGAFAELSQQALKESNASFLQLAKETLERYMTESKGDLEQRKQAVEGLVNPIKEALERYQTYLREVENARKEEYGGLSEQVKALAELERTLQKETTNLVTALKAPQVRGSWGEQTLNRVVEMAGLNEYCDFTQQESVSTEEGRLRPDLVIKMPGDRIIVVDAKNIFQAYYEAVECSDEVKRNAFLNEHLRNVKEHIRKLSSKAYWEQFAQSAEYVVFFMPNENLFIEAMKRDNSIFEEALKVKIIMAHPVTLVALLQTVALTWKQQKLSENTEYIKDLGKELYDRLSKMAEHFAKMGNSLEKPVDNYNSAIASLESRVLITARKFDELGISGKGEIGELSQIEKTPRQISAP